MSKTQATNQSISTLSSTPVRSEGPDRQGYTYNELLAVQARHLAWMKELIAPKHFAALQAFCARKTKPCIPAKWPHGCHEVPRGVQLYQFLIERAQFVLQDDGELDLGKDQISLPKSD